MNQKKFILLCLILNFILNPWGQVLGSSHRFSNVTLYDEKGSFLVGDQNIYAYNSPDASKPVVATYEPGMQFLFDQVGINKYNFWLSYVSSSGARRYVPIPTPHDGAGFPAPPLGIMLSNNSTYSFGHAVRGAFKTNKKLGIRKSPKISATKVSYYDSGESLDINFKDGDEVLTADGHYWISYIAKNGRRYYLPIGKVSEQELWGKFELDY